MSKRNKHKYNVRYEIAKLVYPDYLILIETSKNKLGLKTYKKDKIILDYIKEITHNSRIKLYNYLKENNINYIVLDNYSNITICNCNNNYYKLYLKKRIIKIIVISIKDRYKEI